MGKTNPFTAMIADFFGEGIVDADKPIIVDPKGDAGVSCKPVTTSGRRSAPRRTNTKSER